MVKCQGDYLLSHDRTRLTFRMDNVHSLFWLNSRWIRLSDLLLVSKWLYVLLPRYGEV